MKGEWLGGRSAGNPGPIFRAYDWLRARIFGVFVLPPLSIRSRSHFPLPHHRRRLRPRFDWLPPRKLTRCQAQAPQRAEARTCIPVSLPRRPPQSGPLLAGARAVVEVVATTQHCLQTRHLKDSSLSAAANTSPTTAPCCPSAPISHIHRFPPCPLASNACMQSHRPAQRTAAALDDVTQSVVCSDN